jgi:hypothetical protein
MDYICFAESEAGGLLCVLFVILLGLGVGGLWKNWLQVKRPEVWIEMERQKAEKRRQALGIVGVLLRVFLGGR